VDSKTAKPNFKHGVDLGEMYRPVLNANERSYLHVILKVLKRLIIRLNLLLKLKSQLD
jgi:hypothetical protein